MLENKNHNTNEISNIIRDAENLKERIAATLHSYNICKDLDAKILHKKRREGD